VALWHSGNEVVHIINVTLRQAWLLLRCMSELLVYRLGM